MYGHVDLRCRRHERNRVMNCPLLKWTLRRSAGTSTRSNASNIKTGGIKSEEDVTDIVHNYQQKGFVAMATSDE
jgi:hypothetical protein